MQTFIYCKVTLHVSGVRAPIIRSTKNDTIMLIKKVQLDATICRHLFTAKSLYMFRASEHPSSGALKMTL